jgi:hypothetical protein
MVTVANPVASQVSDSAPSGWLASMIFDKIKGEGGTAASANILAQLGYNGALGFQRTGNYAEGLIKNQSVKEDWGAIEKLIKSDPRVTQFMVDAYKRDPEYTSTLGALASKMDADPAFAHKLAETVKNDPTQIGKEWNGFRAARHSGTIDSYVGKFKENTPAKPSSSASVAAPSSSPERGGGTAAPTTAVPGVAAKPISPVSAGVMPAPSTSVMTADEANAQLDDVLSDPKNELLLRYMNTNPGLKDKMRAAIKEDPSRILSMTDPAMLKEYLAMVDKKESPDTFLNLFKNHGSPADSRSIANRAETEMLKGLGELGSAMNGLKDLPIIGSFFEGMMPMVDSAMHLLSQQGAGVNMEKLLSRSDQKLDNGAVIPAAQNVPWNEYLLNTRVDLIRDPAYAQTAQSDLKAAGLTDGQIHRLANEPYGTLMVAARQNDDGSYVMNKGNVSYDLVSTTPDARTEKMTATARTYNMDYVAHDPQKKPEPEIMAGPSMKHPLGSV